MVDPNPAVSIHLHSTVREKIDENKKLLAMKKKDFIIHSRGKSNGDE